MIAATRAIRLCHVGFFLDERAVHAHDIFIGHLPVAVDEGDRGTTCERESRSHVPTHHAKLLYRRKADAGIVRGNVGDDRGSWIVRAVVICNEDDLVVDVFAIEKLANFACRDACGVARAVAQEDNGELGGLHAPRIASDGFSALCYRTHMRIFLRAHAAALCVAFFVGACAVFPSLIAPLAIGSAYHGMQFGPLDDEDLYRARIHEILDGHPGVVSAFFYEYKNAPLNAAPFDEWMYAAPAFVFGLSAVFLAYKFLLPALLFFLAYFLTRKIMGGEGREAAFAAITAGLLVVIGIEFIDYGYIISLFHSAPPRALLWTRPVHPIIGGLELFGYLTLMWQIIRGALTEDRPLHYKGPSFVVVGGAGILLTLMLGYYFALGVALSVSGVLFLAYLYLREYRVVREFLYVGCVAFITSAPYLYKALSSFGGEGGRAAVMRAGMVFTHTPVVNKALLVASILALLCFAYAYFRGAVQERKHEWMFLGALMLGGWIAFNEQVITGRQIWYPHFVQYTGPLALVTLIIASFFSIRPVFPRAWKMGVGALTGLCLIYSLYMAAFVFPAREADFRALQRYGPLMQRLESTPGECVVFVVEPGEEASRLIPGYTHCDVYLSGFIFYAVPDERILHDYLLHLRMNEITPTTLPAYLASHDSELRSNLYTDWDQLFGLDTNDAAWMQGRMQYVEKEYATFVQPDLKTQLLKYRLDYVVSEAPLSQKILAQLPGLHEMPSAGVFHLYSFAK